MLTHVATCCRLFEALKSLPKTLQTNIKELMRHESIETTLRFYVGQNAAKTSAILWEAHRMQRLGTILGTSSGNREASDSKSAINPEE